MRHHYWAHALGPVSCNYWSLCPRACTLQQGKPGQWEAWAKQRRPSGVKNKYIIFKWKNLKIYRHHVSPNMVYWEKHITSVVFLPNTPESESVSCSVLSDSWQSYGLEPSRLLCPWNSPGKNTGMGSHSLLQGIFPIFPIFDPGVKAGSPTLQADTFPPEPPGIKTKFSQIRRTH